MQINRSHKNMPKRLIITTLVIIILLGGYLFIAKASSLWPFQANNQKNSSKNNETSSNTSDKPTQEAEDYVKDGGGSQDSSPSQGSGVTDTGGSNVTKQSGGISSSSGDITLYSPTTDQTISNGVKVSGSANVSEVFYRINDTTHGMIANGRLAVKNGLFSGTINVNTDASTGTFEVYSFNSQGQEINNISVDIRY